MKDKEKIRAEVERQMQHHVCGYKNALKDILKFIDSLPEEPVSKDLEEAAYKQIPENKGYSTIIDKVVDYNSEKRRYWLMGAQWQKEQMMKDAIDWEIEGEKVKVIIINEDYKEVVSKTEITTNGTD